MAIHPVAIRDLFLIGIMTITGFSCGTSRSADSNKQPPRPSDSILIDRDGNKYSVKLLLDGKWWMTSDLKLNIPNSYCYNDAIENCERYGRLYLWGVAQEGCKLLGAEWRLPTSEDGRELTRLYGGGHPDSSATRKAAFKTLMPTGSSGFNAVLGGGRNPDKTYGRLDAHGFYWTATANDSTAWFFNFAKGSQALYMQPDGEKTRAFAVRCVKDK